MKKKKSGLFGQSVREFITFRNNEQLCIAYHWKMKSGMYSQRNILLSLSTPGTVSAQRVWSAGISQGEVITG